MLNAPGVSALSVIYNSADALNPGFENLVTSTVANVTTRTFKFRRYFPNVLRNISIVATATASTTFALTVSVHRTSPVSNPVNGPETFVYITGQTANMVLNINGVVNYELVPNSLLAPDVKVSYNDLPESDFHAARAFLARLAEKGMSGVVKRSEYSILKMLSQSRIMDRSQHYGHWINRAISG